MQANAPWTRWARVGTTALLLGVHLEGCASGGATPGIGTPTPDALEDLHLTSVPEGTQVRIILHGDSLVSGKFRGVSRMESGAYARRVAEFRAARTDSTPLPAPGSSVRVRRGSKDRAALLDGFGYRSLELRWKSSNPPQLLRFDDFRDLTDSSGHVWTRDALDQEVIRGRVPCFTVIEVENENGRTQVPADQVTNVVYRTPSGRWVVGALVIVTLAVFVVAITREHHKAPEPQCEGPSPGLLFAREAGLLASLRSARAP